jgi:hypothetical protein
MGFPVKRKSVLDCLCRFIGGEFSKIDIGMVNPILNLRIEEGGCMKTRLLIILIIVFWSLPLLAQEVDTAWVRTYNGPGDTADYVRGLAIDGSGNVYVTGASVGSGTDYDYATIKYHPDGDTAWVRRYNGPGDVPDRASAIAVDDSSNVYVTGYSYDSVTDYDYATIKYCPNGDTAWIRRYNGPGDYSDVAHDIAVDDSGNVYVTGHSSGSGTSYDYATIKYYPNGDTAWVRRYNGPENGWDFAHVITSDGSGNVYVTGRSDGSGTEIDYATIKYNPNGDTAWVRRYNGPADSTDRADAIAVDGSGNVYVTGYSYGSGTDRDYATVKYDQSGNELWVRRYDGPANSSDGASAIAVDGSGNAYVTGSSYDILTHHDCTTIKYYPYGDTAWVRRYNGPADSSDAASAIAVDGSGNVYVTGYSWSDGTSYDYATMKYYPNGDTSWVTTYNGDADSMDTGADIAVDDSGNVYVTGLSCGDGTDLNYATIKYYQHNDPPDSFSLLLPPNKAFTPRRVRFDWEDAADPNPFDQIRYDLYVSTSYHSFLDSATVDSNLVASEHTKILDYGTYYWKVIAKDNFGAERECDRVHYFMVTGLHASLGNFNGDGSIDVADVVFLINYLYASGPAPDPLELGDVNCDDGVSIADVIFLMNYLFKDGPAPSC